LVTKEVERPEGEKLFRDVAGCKRHGPAWLEARPGTEAPDLSKEGGGLLSGPGAEPGSFRS